MRTWSVGFLALGLGLGVISMLQLVGVFHGNTHQAAVSPEQLASGIASALLPAGLGSCCIVVGLVLLALQYLGRQRAPHAQP